MCGFFPTYFYWCWEPATLYKIKGVYHTHFDLKVDWPSQMPRSQVNQRWSLMARLSDFVLANIKDVRVGKVELYWSCDVFENQTLSLIRHAAQHLYAVTSACKCLKLCNEGCLQQAAHIPKRRITCDGLCFHSQQRSTCCYEHVQWSVNVSGKCKRRPSAHHLDEGVRVSGFV